MNKAMQAHYQLSDDEFVSHFEQLTLTPSWLTHEAHIRLAWHYIKTSDIKTASQKLCEKIQMFDRALDKGTKYHKTVTIALTQLIVKRETQHSTENFKAFIQQNSDLLTDYKQLLAEYYSYDLFQDRKAKMIYVSPDLKSF